MLQKVGLVKEQPTKQNKTKQQLYNRQINKLMLQ